jgi:hypothetical protein
MVLYEWTRPLGSEVSSTLCTSMGSFGSHHLGLESKNSFMILTITCLAATELVMEFIWNSLDFHLMPNLNTYWVPYHFCGFFKMKWYYHVISFYFYQMKWNDRCQTSPKGWCKVSHTKANKLRTKPLPIYGSCGRTVRLVRHILHTSLFQISFHSH